MRHVPERGPWRGEMRAVAELFGDLAAAAAAPLALATLAEGNGHGYAIARRIRELSEGRVQWTDGMLYPVLHRLQRLGHVEARWEAEAGGRRRKRYRITPRGRAQWRAHRW